MSFNADPGNEARQGNAKYLQYELYNFFFLLCLMYIYIYTYIYLYTEYSYSIARSLSA